MMIQVEEKISQVEDSISHFYEVQILLSIQ